MNYLVYVEHSAENLQFFLWYRSFAARFSSANKADLALAPEWTEEREEEAFAKLRTDQRDKLRRDPAEVAAMFVGTDFEKRGNAALPKNNFSFVVDGPSPIVSENGPNPFSTPPHTPQGDRHSAYGGSNGTNYRSQVAEAFVSAGAKVPCESNHSTIIT